VKARVLAARDAMSGEGLRAAVDAILSGKILAYPAETMYGIGGDALRADVAARLAEAKGSPRGRPFLLLLSSTDDWKEVAASFPDEARFLASRFWPGPLTLLLQAREDCAAAESGKVAVRVPDLPLVRTWMREAKRPIFSTSANRSGEPPVRDPLELETLLGDRVDLIVSGPVFPSSGAPSTIVDCTSVPPRLVRAGAVPFP